MCAFNGPFAQASAILLLQASSSPHSGYTSVEKAIHLPSGDHSGSDTPVEILVIFRTEPPPVAITLRLVFPSCVLMKAIHLPSGDHSGEFELLSPSVSWRAFAPSMSIIHIWLT